MIITEGKAKIFYDENFLKNLSSDLPVFYNPLMKINRDFTIYILEAYYNLNHRKLNILDSMAATGIRSIRILKEIPEVVDMIYINDIKKEAIENIKENLKLNEINDKYILENKDCRILMLEKKFDYIDIDPFGTPIKFIDIALQSLKYKGIIGITATDISALSCSKPSACFRKYNTIGIKTSFYLEFGLRNLIKYVLLTGYKYDISLRPIFGYYYKHHYRVFFIKERTKEDLIENIREFYYCERCGNVDLENNICKVCGNKMRRLGPIYIGKIYDNYYVEYINKKELDENERKVIDRIYNCDSKTNLWYYYDIRKLQSFFKKNLPKIEILLEKYNACRTHYTDYGLKAQEFIFL